MSEYLAQWPSWIALLPMKTQMMRMTSHRSKLTPSVTSCEAKRTKENLTFLSIFHWKIWPCQLVPGKEDGFHDELPVASPDWPNCDKHWTVLDLNGFIIQRTATLDHHIQRTYSFQHSTCPSTTWSGSKSLCCPWQSLWGSRRGTSCWRMWGAPSWAASPWSPGTGTPRRDKQPGPRSEAASFPYSTLKSCANSKFKKHYFWKTHLTLSVLQSRLKFIFYGSIWCEIDK